MKEKIKKVNMKVRSKYTLIYHEIEGSQIELANVASHKSKDQAKESDL